mmetsp:Transcript_89191/g.154427  ORF Transcript_89191/g.154427 Transcript_89191/m.154427 type:complete len:1101 (+) Transcript_89191:78-3380(+)
MSSLTDLEHAPTEAMEPLFGVIPMAQEFYLFFFFGLGFVVFKAPYFQKRLRGLNAGFLGLGTQKVLHEEKLCSIEKLRSDFKKRDFEEVLAGWPLLKEYTVEALSIAVTSLIALGRPDDVGMFVAKTAANLPHLKAHLHKMIAALLSPPCEVRRQHIAEALRSIADEALSVLNVSAVEVLGLSLARVNDKARVESILGFLKRQGTNPSASLLKQLSRTFLESNNLDASLGYLRQVLASGTEVPHDLILSIVRVSTEAAISEDPSTLGGKPKAWDALDALQGTAIHSDAASLFMEWAARQTPADVAMAERAEKLLRAQGPLPPPAFDALVRMHASSAGDQAKAIACFDELVSSLQGGPSEGSLVSMISSCMEAQNWGLAEHIVDWARSQERCTMPIFSATLRVFAAAKQFKKICSLYEAVTADGLSIDAALLEQLPKFAAEAGRSELAHSLSRKTKNPDALNYVSLMQACGKDGKVWQALDMLRDLQQQGEVDTTTFNCALDVCVSCEDADAAEAVFKEMKACGKIDAVSYNIMLKRHVGEGRSPRGADNLLQDMRQSGLKPNTATYNTLLGAAIGHGDFGRALRTLDLMESSGQGVDAYTISILFKGFKRDRQSVDICIIDRGLALIQKYAVKVDEVLANAALEAIAAQRDMGRLTQALETFKQRGFAVSKCSMYTYGMLIKAYAQTQDIDEVWRLWNEVIHVKDLEPSEQLYSQMVDALVSNNCFNDALQLFEEMKATHSERLNSQGFAVAYNSIIHGFAQRKECAKALECYEEMKEHGTKMCLVILNTLIDACSRVGDMDSAAHVFRDMVELQCVPDLITYSTLIKGYCICGDLDQAMELFALMKKKGIVPDAIVFNSLLDGCAKNQMTGLCEQLVQDMEDAGVSPSNYSASILIKLYGRCKDLDAAFKVMNEMPKKYGFRANAAVYTCLMQACIANDRMQAAMDLRMRMQRERVFCDEKTYSTLLRGALRANSVEFCVQLIDAALSQSGTRGGPRYLLDEDLVKSVLVLTQRRGYWESHGQDLLERLQAAGVRAQFPSTAEQRHGVGGGNRGDFRPRGDRQHHNGSRNYGSGNNADRFQKRSGPPARGPWRPQASQS